MTAVDTPNIFENPPAFYEFKINSGELSAKYPDLLKRTLFEISRNVPALSELIKDNIDFIFGLPECFRKDLLNNISIVASANKLGTEALKEFAKSYADVHCRIFISEFNATPGRKILFITGVPSGQILREARALRKKGYSVALIFMAPIAEDGAEAICKGFDLCLQLPENLLVLKNVLTDIQTELIHLQCFMHSSHLPYPSVVLENKGTSKVICELVDILTIFSEKWALAQYHKEFAEFNYMLDEIIWTKGDGYIVRAPEIAHADLKQRYSVSAPIIEMHQFPSEDLFQPINKERYNSNRPCRLVYAGGLTPLKLEGSKAVGIWHRYSDGVGMLSAFESMARQGLDLTVLHDPNRPLNNPDFDLYWQCSNSYSNFQLLEGVPYDKLARTIASFDFGISLVTLNRDELDLRDILFQTAVATKIFSYLEAGLPVIVNKEHEYTAEIIEDNNLGFAVHSHEIAQLSSKIANFDYNACLESIKYYNNNNKIENKIDEIIKLYNKISNY